jgi:hypothetical protein
MRLIIQPATRAQVTLAEVRELDYRESGGVAIALLWDRRTDELTVTVTDTSSGDAFELTVDSQVALDAFRHPYAYAAWSGVQFLAPAPELALTLPD